MEVFINEIWDDRYGCPGIYSIHRCPLCKQMVTMPPLVESDLPHLYSTYYPRREVEYSALEKEAALVLAPFAKLKRWLSGTNNQGHYFAKTGQKVLDIGVGSCLSLLENQNLGIEGYGIEADPNVARIAQHFHLRVHVGSIHDQPFPGELFNMVVLNQVIEHVPDPEALMRTVLNRLTPGGRVVMSFPNVNSLQRKLSGAKWINWHVPYHQHHFNRQSFSQLAKKVGYEVIRASTITPNLWTILQLRSMMEKVEVGIAADGWAHGGASSGVINFSNRIKNKVIRELRGIFNILIILFNRTVDVLGQGDSLLVELRVRK